MSDHLSNRHNALFEAHTKLKSKVDYLEPRLEKLEEALRNAQGDGR